jgi:predicted nucleic acid-binding protein
VVDYLLDTNILSYWYDSTCPQHDQVAAKIREVRQPDPQTGYVSRLFISVVTLAEVEYGHSVTNSPNVEAQTAYRTFIAQELPPALEISRHIHEPYAKLRSWLFNKFSSKKRRARRPEELLDPTTARELGIQENDCGLPLTRRCMAL